MSCEYLIFYLEGVFSVIEVTRLGGGVFFINADQIETIEATPDTVITLVNARRYVIKESTAIVVDKIVNFRRQSFPDVL